MSSKQSEALPRISGERSHRPVVGISCFVVNLLLMTVLTVLVKLLAERYSLNQILAIRFLSALAFFSVLLFPRYGVTGLRTSRPLDHAIRSLSGVTSLSLFFYAVTMIPIADATAISYAAPIFITVLAIFVLKEKIGVYRWLAVLFGFVGVLVISQPSPGEINTGVLAAIGSAVGAAIVSVWIRRLSSSEKSVTIGFYYNLTGTIICVSLLSVGGWNELQSRDLILFASFAICCGLQQWFLTISFRYAEASLIAPFDYLAMVFAAVAGIVVWNEIPSVNSIIGALIISASGLFIFLRQRQMSPPETSASFSSQQRRLL